MAYRKPEQPALRSKAGQSSGRRSAWWTRQDWAGVALSEVTVPIRHSPRSSGRMPALAMAWRAASTANWVRVSPSRAKRRSDVLRQRPSSAKDLQSVHISFSSRTTPMARNF